MTTVYLKESTTASLNQLDVPTYTEYDTRRAADVILTAPEKTYQYSAFGDVSVSQNTPIIRGSFAYGFLPTNFRAFTGGNGTSAVSGYVYKVESGTISLGYGTIQSFRSINYKEGDGALIRISARFPNPVALTWSGVGGITIGDEVSFGYNGTTFGIWHRYLGNAEVQTLTVSAGASGAGNATVTIDNTVYTVPLTAGSAAQTANEIAAYLTTNATAWTATQNGSTVVIHSLSDGNKTGTFSYSSAVSTASWAETTAGVTKSYDFVAQADWNGELFDGFDPSKGNTYQISYQNGFGDICFYIEDPDTSRLLLVHIIKWNNAKATPNMANPSLRVGAYAYSVGATTSTSVEASYFMGALEGVESYTRNPRSYANTKSIGTTATNIFSIRNRTVYNGRINQAEIEPVFVTFANDGSKSAIFELRGNATIAGFTNFANVGTNLISEVDVAGTTVTGGTLFASFTVAKGQSITVDLKDFNIRLPPTVTISVIGYMASGAAADLSASLAWYEDV